MAAAATPVVADGAAAAMAAAGGAGRRRGDERRGGAGIGAGAAGVAAARQLDQAAAFDGHRAAHFPAQLLADDRRHHRAAAHPHRGRGEAVGQPGHPGEIGLGGGQRIAGDEGAAVAQHHLVEAVFARVGGGRAAAGDRAGAGQQQLAGAVAVGRPEGAEQDARAVAQGHPHPQPVDPESARGRGQPGVAAGRLQLRHVAAAEHQQLGRRPLHGRLGVDVKLAVGRAGARHEEGAGRHVDVERAAREEAAAAAVEGAGIEVEAGEVVHPQGDPAAGARTAPVVAGALVVAAGDVDLAAAGQAVGAQHHAAAGARAGVVELLAGHARGPDLAVEHDRRGVDGDHPAAGAARVAAVGAAAAAARQGRQVDRIVGAGRRHFVVTHRALAAMAAARGARRRGGAGRRQARIVVGAAGVAAAREVDRAAVFDGQGAAQQPGEFHAGDRRHGGAVFDHHVLARDAGRQPDLAGQLHAAGQQRIAGGHAAAAAADDAVELVFADVAGSAARSGGAGQQQLAGGVAVEHPVGAEGGAAAAGEAYPGTQPVRPEGGAAGEPGVRPARREARHRAAAEGHQLGLGRQAARLVVDHQLAVGGRRVAHVEGAAGGLQLEGAAREEAAAAAVEGGRAPTATGTTSRASTPRCAASPWTTETPKPR